MFTFLMVIQALIAAALVGVILIQKSEGGGLGVGGSPSGFMSARGAADFLTRTTQVLGALFVAFSILLAALAVQMSGGSQTVDTSLNRAAPVAPKAPADPLSAAVANSAAPAAAGSAAASPAATPAPADPLAPATHK